MKGLKRSITCLFCLIFVFVSMAQAQEKGTAPSAIELEKTVVTATKTEHSLGDVPIAAEVITKEEIKAKNIKTVQDALIHLTGIKIRKSCGSWGNKGNVQMQGLDAKHTLILVDGQRYYGGHGAVDLHSIPIEMIERIEVVKGPASALYGSDAVGGVINIITKSAPEKPTFTASSAFGSRKTQVHEASGGFKKGKLASFLNFSYRESDGVKAEYIDSKGKKQTDWYDECAFQGSFQYEFTPQSKLTLKPYYSEHTIKRGISAEEMQNYKQERFSLNPVWEWSPDDLSKLNLTGSWFNYKQYTDDRTSDAETDTYEAEINYSRLIMQRHTITAGYQYRNDGIDDKKKNLDLDRTTHGYFLQDEIDLDPFIFVPAVRIDDHDEWGTEVNPKASMLYRVTEDFKLRGSVGRAFKEPSFTALYAEGWKMGRSLMHANPDLNPEKSIAYQLGAEWRVHKNLMGKISLFRNDVEDLIQGFRWNVGRQSHMKWINIAKARTQGIEFSLLSQLMDNLTSKLGYTFLDTEDEETGKELTNRPKHKLDVEFNWRIPEFGLNLNLSGGYIGKRYDDKENTIKLGGYTVFDFALTKDITKYGELFFRMNNMFGKKNIEDEYDIDGAEFLCGVKMTF